MQQAELKGPAHLLLEVEQQLLAGVISPAVKFDQGSLL